MTFDTKKHSAGLIIDPAVNFSLKLVFLSKTTLFKENKNNRQSLLSFIPEPKLNLKINLKRSSMKYLTFVHLFIIQN